MKLRITNTSGKTYKYSGFTDKELRTIAFDHIHQVGNIAEIEFIDDSKWPYETRTLPINS